jgi:D-galactose 1-dehydrogenase
MRAIRVAIVGVGKIARDQHVPAIAKNPHFKLAATVSLAGEIPGVPSFSQFAALLRDGPAIDAVAICTPPQSRAALAHEAIAAGLHVLLEKPPTVTVLVLKTLKRQAAVAGTSLFTAWHSRYAPMVDVSRGWLANRRLRRGRIIWREDVRHWHPGQMWLWEPGGLGVFDPGINALSLLTALTPESVSIENAEFDMPENAHTPIAARLSMRVGEAAVDVDLDFLQTGTQTWAIELEAEDGRTLRLEHGGTRLTLPDESQRSAPEAEYPGLYRRFAELIAAGASDVDATPLQLVADAFMLARVRRVSAFNY